MSTIKPGVVCVTQNCRDPKNNGRIVTVVRREPGGRSVLSQEATRYTTNPGWWCRAPEPFTIILTNGAVTWDYEGSFEPHKLKPFGGDDLGITEEDVKELYQPNLTKEKMPMR